MKYQLNWQLIDLSNNHLLKKKIDNCVILYDDKDYILVSLKYYKELLFTTYHSEEVNPSDIYEIFDSSIADKLRDLVKYGDYILAPIYFSTCEMGLQIINIGIFILSDFSVINDIGSDFRQCFMSVIKHGIEPTSTDIDKLRTERYPELKADIDDILYIKQAGFYFNLLKSLYYTCNKSSNKTYLHIPIMSRDDIKIIDAAELFETAFPYWERWQIIWRSNKYAITHYFKNKKWNSESNITDNTTKKYRNIVFNQSLMSENRVINSLSKNIFKPITHSGKSLKGKNNTDNDNLDVDLTISKMGNLSLCGKKSISQLGLDKQLKRYAKFSGSKHLHYLHKEKVKEAAISEMLKDLKF